MSLIDLHGAFWVFAGIITGSVIGAINYGILGALVGIPLGLLAGVVVLYLLSFMLAIICKLAFGGPFFAPRKDVNEPPDKVEKI